MPRNKLPVAIIVLKYHLRSEEFYLSFVGIKITSATINRDSERTGRIL
jgi:hypothetical protein